MSKYYNLIKGYYDQGYWDISRVKAMVVRGWITTEEYKLITGQEYEV